MTRKSITVYIDKGIYEKLRQLIAPKLISRELEDLMRKRIEELEGREYDPLEHIDYEALKQEYDTIIRKIDKLKGFLEKRGAYRKLLALAVKIKLNPYRKEDYAEILKRWRGRREDAHQFISLIELTNKQREIEQKLEEIRLRNVQKHDFSSERD